MCVKWKFARRNEARILQGDFPREKWTFPESAPNHIKQRETTFPIRTTAVVVYFVLEWRKIGKALNLSRMTRLWIFWRMKMFPLSISPKIFRKEFERERKLLGKRRLKNLPPIVLKRRVIGEHFITYFIDYDYEAPTKKQMASMRKTVSKTIPLVEDYDCMYTILGSALTVRATLGQTMLFFLGDASSGKSNVL